MAYKTLPKALTGTYVHMLYPRWEPMAEHGLRGGVLGEIREGSDTSS